MAKLIIDNVQDIMMSELSRFLICLIGYRLSHSYALTDLENVKVRIAQVKSCSFETPICDMLGLSFLVDSLDNAEHANLT